MKDVVIVGSTGCDLFLVTDAMHDRDPGGFRIIGFLDDNPATHGTEVFGYKVLGGTDLLKTTYKDVWVFNNVARSMSIRETVWEKLTRLDCNKYFSAIHPDVDVRRARIGEGVMVLPGAVIGPYAEIGDQTIVSFHSVVGHESTVGPCSFVGPGVLLNGRVKLGRGVFVGVGASIFTEVTVGDYAVVGAGSLVTSDVPAGCTVFGSPARIFMQPRPKDSE